MKNIIIAVFLLSILISCNKNNTNTNPTNPPPQQQQALNNTEQQLVGTWYLQKHETFLTDTTYTFTGFTNSCYAQFKTDAYFPDTYPDYYKQINNSFTGATPTYAPAAVLDPWYYDTGLSKLIIAGKQFDILTLTGNTLTIKTGTATLNDTYYFTK